MGRQDFRVLLVLCSLTIVSSASVFIAALVELATGGQGAFSHPVAAALVSGIILCLMLVVVARALYTIITLLVDDTIQSVLEAQSESRNITTPLQIEI